MAILVRFVRESDLTSSMIAWFSAGPTSHVDIILPDGTALGSRNDKVGGKPSGVQIRPAGYAKFAYVTYATVECSPEQEARFYKFAREQIGKPYDRLAIFAFLIGRNWRDSASWYCSEYVSRCFEVSLIVPPLYLIANKITPPACALFLSAIGAKFTEVMA